MPTRLIPWVVVAFASVTAVVWLASSRFVIGLVAGVLAALASGAIAAISGRSLVRQLDALTAVARVVETELEPAAAEEDPNKLARDVNEVAQRAKALGRELSTLTAVVDGMVEGLWITDRDGTIIRHNNALKEMLFVAGQPLIGQSPVEVLRSAELQEAVTRACRQGESSHLEISVEGLRPRTLSIDVSPLREVGGSAAVFHDVTDLRRLEKIRKDFVANVSHELRTPLTVIRGYAETLQAGALDDRANAAQMVEIIHRQSERLSELVEDLLELSRLESRELQLESGPVPLGEAVARAAEAVRPRMDSKALTLRLELPEGLAARGDARAIERVILNLLDNAAKYTARGGRVVVSAEPLDGQCALHVADTGSGIEAKHLPRIFERFYRVDKGRSRDTGGTGLGLAIVKHLVTAMGGDVKVKSQPGEGSTFTVLLPPA